MKVRVQFVILMLALGTTQKIQAMEVKLNCRVRPSNQGLTLVYRVENKSNATIEFRDLDHAFYYFDRIKLHESSRKKARLGKPSSFSDPMIRISPGNSSHWLGKAYNIPLYEFNTGAYVLLAWYISAYPVGVRAAQYICLGLPDENGNMRSPVVNPSNANIEIYLGFIDIVGRLPDVSFLFLNGSNETVNVDKPLTQASRIVATAPTIGYTNELFIAGQPSESIAIEAGKVGEWRIPWQTIHDLIPAADLAAIKAAGGDLDLVWKVGDFESEPLPISLAEPENNAVPE